MISSDEIRATHIVNGTRRGIPWSVVVAVFLVASVIIGNFITLSNRAHEAKELAAINARVARQASEASYHNCVVLRALVEWSEELTPLERPHLGAKWSPADKYYHGHRFRAFSKLGRTLRKINGVPCASPLFGQHSASSDNKRK